MNAQDKVNVDISYEHEAHDEITVSLFSRLTEEGIRLKMSRKRDVYTIGIEHGAYEVSKKQIEDGNLKIKEDKNLNGQGHFNQFEDGIWHALENLSSAFEEAATTESVVTFKPLQNGMTKATLWKFDEATETYSTKSAICDGFKVISPKGFVPDNQP